MFNNHVIDTKKRRGRPVYIYIYIYIIKFTEKILLYPIIV